MRQIDGFEWAVFQSKLDPKKNKEEADDLLAVIEVILVVKKIEVNERRDPGVEPRQSDFKKYGIGFSVVPLFDPNLDPIQDVY